MTTDKPSILPFTQVFIKLLKGPLEYIEKTTWEQLLTYQAELTRYLQQVGLILVLVVGLRLQLGLSPLRMTARLLLLQQPRRRGRPHA